MEKIEHLTVPTNGINMHVAAIGSGPAVLFLHGFPETWYCWRHQLLYLSSRGYRCLAPDLRGYGDSDVPPSASSYTAFHIVGDLVGLLDALGLEKVFLVAHDWGALMAWYFCLFRPDRVKALVNLSVAFSRRNPELKPVEGLRAFFGDDYYICRFQEVGWAEENFAKLGNANMLRIFLTSRNPKPCIPKEGFQAFPGPPPLPSWLSEEDINYVAKQFEKSGFVGGLNYYRALDLTWELTAPWTGMQIKVPVKFMVGDLDVTYHFPGAKDYINGSMFKEDVPFLQEVVVMEGVGHFINEERAGEVGEHIYDFIKKF